MLRILLLELTILILQISLFTGVCGSSMLWLHVVQPNLTAGNGFDMIYFTINLYLKKYSIKVNSLSMLVILARIDRIERAYFERNGYLCE
jgi:hypothetical protein